MGETADGQEHCLKLGYSFVDQSVVFQIVSARSLWDWRLYPKELDREVRLKRSQKDSVDIGLTLSSGDARSHGRNFLISKVPVEGIDIRVSLRTNDAGAPIINVWYT